MQATAIVVGVALVIMLLSYGPLPSLGPVAAVDKVSGSWALIIMTLSLIDSNTVNAYTGTFQILAFGGMWRRFKSESVIVRLVPFVCVMAAGVVTACLGYLSFVTNLTNFLDILLVILIPWSAVNLTDYFLVRRGRYDVASFFTADGAYGRFAWRGLLAYTVGIAAEWPFVSQPDYTGPLVPVLGPASQYVTRVRHPHGSQHASRIWSDLVMSAVTQGSHA